MWHNYVRQRRWELRTRSVTVFQVNQTQTERNEKKKKNDDKTPEEKVGFCKRLEAGVKLVVLNQKSYQ